MAAGQRSRGVFERVRDAQKELHDLLQSMQDEEPEGRPLLPGLDRRRGASFSIGNLRPARRIGLQGEFRTEMVVELVQTHRPPAAPIDAAPFRGGATLIVDLRTWAIRYIIAKRLYQQLPSRPRGDAPLTDRCRRQRRFEEQQRALAPGGPRAVWQGEATANLAEWLAATYACEERRAARRAKQTRDEPFALLHRGVE